MGKSTETFVAAEPTPDVKISNKETLKPSTLTVSLPANHSLTETALLKYLSTRNAKDENNKKKVYAVRDALAGKNLDLVVNGQLEDADKTKITVDLLDLANGADLDIVLKSI